MPPRKPPAFHRPRRIEAEYLRDLEALMRRWLPFAHFDSLEEAYSALAVLGERGDLPEAQRLAAQMVAAAAKQDAGSWRKAAEQGNGRRIHEMLRSSLQGDVGRVMRVHIRAHAKLISTVPQNVAQEAAAYVAKRQAKGERADAIIQDLRRKLPGLAAYRIDTLARTQVASTVTAITRARADSLELPWYEWDTSEDLRVRPSHRNMDLVLVRWKEPPAPEELIGVESKLGHYHAGNCPNCRCDANVLVDLDQVSWPHKVYYEGRISRMGRRAFEKIM